MPFIIIFDTLSFPMLPSVDDGFQGKNNERNKGSGGTWKDRSRELLESVEWVRW